MKIEKKQVVKNLGELLLGTGAGYVFFWLTSHKRSPVHTKIPKKVIKNISYLPHIKVIGKEKHYHLHHWVNMSVLYIFLFLTKPSIFRKRFINGFLVGSILQGLSYSDRFSFIYTSQE